MKTQRVHADGNYRIHFVSQGQIDMDTARLEAESMEFVLSRYDDDCRSELMSRAIITISVWGGEKRFLIHEIVSYEGEPYCRILLDVLSNLAANKGFTTVYMKKRNHSNAFWNEAGFEDLNYVVPMVKRQVAE